jgi:hypothetical protein
LPAVLVEDFQRLSPGLLLAVVDLAEIEHLALGRAPAAGAAILHHAEIAVALAVLATFVVTQKYRRQLSQFCRRQFKRVGLHHTVRRIQSRARAAGSRKTGAKILELSR